MGVHQKIDRVARRRLKPFIPKDVNFPETKKILHYEGLNGPDGIKRKSPAKDEPWHYIDPSNPKDTALYDMIDEHIYNLGEALKKDDVERAAFEAAWMAHAITDGLTPPHHYPLAKKLEQLRGGLPLESRTSTKDKLLLPGDTRIKQLANNWEYWGTKGVMTTHLGFELGVALAVSTANLNRHQFSDVDIAALESTSFRELYSKIIQRVNDMHMFNNYKKTGWTKSLASQTRSELVPMIIRAVDLGWYAGIIKSQEK